MPKVIKTSNEVTLPLSRAPNRKECPGNRLRPRTAADGALTAGDSQAWLSPEELTWDERRERAHQMQVLKVVCVTLSQHLSLHKRGRIHTRDPGSPKDSLDAGPLSYNSNHMARWGLKTGLTEQRLILLY